MEHILVRTFTSADYPQVCELDRPMFEGMGGYVLFRHVEELFSGLFFVAVDTKTDKIVGYILGGIHLDEPAIGKLIRIGVTPEYRRMECGTMLCRALFDALKAHGVRRVHLTTAESNTAAISFYEKTGFVQTKRVEKYFYPDTPRLVFERDV